MHIRTNLPQVEESKKQKSKGYEVGSYGNTIYLYYAHLSRVNVKVGDKVTHGKVIGKSGSTGNAMHVDAQYRHVHVEAGTDKIIYDDGRKCRLSPKINPENYMKTKFDENGNTL